MKAPTLLPPPFPSSCLLFLLVSSLCNICFCYHNSADPVLCIPKERLALIDLKNNLTDEANRLSSWVGKDCCGWFGVVCDNITGQVHEIRLRGSCYAYYDTGDVEGASRQMLGGTISHTVVKLLQLRYLDLSCNDFGFTSIPTFIGSFQNLIYLNLSYSNFSGEIPHQLGNLSTLGVLDLHDDLNKPYRSIHSKSLAWLKNLNGLQHLDMGGVNLEKASDWFLAISNLTSLRKLYLYSCLLNQLPSNYTTVGFASLVVLDLSSNFYYGMLPGWIFGLRNLPLLDLTDCYFSSVSPGTHGGFHSMPSLRTLRVSHNTFVNSSLILNGLSSLSNLRLLDVSYCDISSPILGNLQNLSLIEHVDLSNNRIVEEIPKSLSNLCNITFLDLQSNNFYGNVSELLERFCECESPKLEYLDFGSHFSDDDFRDDFVLNYLTGQLPERLEKLKILINFDLGYNNLTGIIPDSIGSLSSLVSLGLHQNSLTAILTENHFANLTALKTLWVGDNKLVFKLNVHNWIPPFNLEEFMARSCSLGPKFPSWIQSQTNLQELNLANTNISDFIPNWLWVTVSRLSYLNMSNNNIHGKLEDVTFVPNMITLDLSNNHLHGMLPGNIHRAGVFLLDLSNNNLSGSLEQFLCSGIQEAKWLEVLNLANNNMSGVIPDCWMNFQDLAILNLGKNQFSGVIPSSLGNISYLRSLDINDNRLLTTYLRGYLIPTPW